MIDQHENNFDKLAKASLYDLKELKIIKSVSVYEKIQEDMSLNLKTIMQILLKC